MKQVNKQKETTKVVLIPVIEKPVELIAPAKPKKKRYHKKPKQVVIDTPLVDVIVEKDVLTPIKPNLNWFEKQWNKFVLWYNA